MRKLLWSLAQGKDWVRAWPLPWLKLGQMWLVWTGI
jgi:hypothetical protein